MPPQEDKPGTIKNPEDASLETLFKQLQREVAVLEDNIFKLTNKKKLLISERDKLLSNGIDKKADSRSITTSHSLDGKSTEDE